MLLQCQVQGRLGLGEKKKRKKIKLPCNFSREGKKRRRGEGRKKKLAKQGMESHPPKAQMVQLEDRSFAEDDATQGKQTVLWGVLSLL